MIDFISKMIELLEKLNSYFQKKYPKDMGLIVPAGAKRSQSTRFWADVSASLIIILGIILSLITGFRIWLIYSYYVFLYKLNSNVYNGFTSAFGGLKAILSFGALVLVAVILYTLFQKRRTLTFRGTFLTITIICVSVLALTAGFEKKVEEYIRAEAYYLGFQEFENLEFESARDVFAALESGSRSDEVGEDVQRALAQANLNTGNIEESIIGLTHIISQGNYNEKSGEVLLLHTAIYALGKSIPLNDALNFLDELKKGRDIKELSPIWLGIDPQNNLHFIWDYIGSFEAEPADRVVLRILISKYPDDYYVDLARLAIGEYRDVADTKPNSIFRDWCIYRTAQVAYREQDFNTTINYLSMFVTEFPNHRWTDDAFFRLARSYELSGRPEDALDLLLFSDYYPDGDWMEVIQAYRIALIDYYFDSQNLKNLIQTYQGYQNGNNPYLPVLEYSLAEQLFKEGAFEEANQQFMKVEASYPQTNFAQYANQNIQVLSTIIQIKNNAGNNWPIEVAKYVMEPYLDDDNYDDYLKTTDLVIYNDLYDGKRIAGTSYIGWSGVPWDYYYTANDYLWAERLLERECGGCDQPDEVLYLRLLAYYNLTYPNAYLPSFQLKSQTFGDLSAKVTPEDYSAELVLKNLDQLGAMLLSNFPNSPHTPEALSLNAIGHANRRDYERAAQLMSTLISFYPDHPLANNAAIYSARSYWQLAEDAQDPSLRALYYALAKSAYEMTIEKYPSGHVGKEAVEELAELMLEMK